MTGKLLSMILIAALAAVFCFALFGGVLKQKPDGAAVPNIEQNQNNNQKQNPDKNSGSIDLVRPPFLDE